MRKRCQWLPRWVSVLRDGVPGRALTCAFLLAWCAACAPVPNNGDPVTWMDSQQLQELGEKFLAAGDTGQALRYLTAAVEKAPKDPSIHYDLGLAYEARRLEEKALEHLQKAVELKPDYSEAHNALGVLYAKRGQADKALEHFHKALANPFYRTPHYAYFNIGKIYQDEARYAEALKYFDDAILFEKGYAQAHLHRGRVLEAMGRKGEARHAYRLAVYYGPDLPEAQFHYGRFLVQDGNWEDAAKAFRRVLRLAPGTPLAEAAANYLHTMGFED
ncbi:MAG: tetratricopeptide repeat protein [Desulfacinum sp.]|nr:tetratricopeptide repeat protein [Desulfacinum sp.]